METAIEQMLDDCESAKTVPEANGGPGFTDWELEFLESLRDQVDDGRTLSQRQMSKLEDLWNKV